MARFEWVGPAVLGLVVAGALFYALLPHLIRYILRALFSVRYGFRVRGRKRIPKTGPVVLAINHVSWIDGLFVGATCSRPGHVLSNADFFKSRLLFALSRRAGMIPVPFSGPKAQRAAITAFRAALDRGEVVAIFPEGQLTRNGLLGPFYRGLEVILKGKPDVPVVPVYLDNLWGSLFSFKGGRAFGKRPVGLRRRINIIYGPPMVGPPTLFELRTAILSAGVDAAALRPSPPEPLETIDPALPRLQHERLGLLTGSAQDYDRDGIRQPGRREGTVGLPLPGVALRTVDEAGLACGPDVVGRLEARTVSFPGWTDTGWFARIDADGFIRIESTTKNEPAAPI